jgi:hypothetical protein
VNHPEYKSKITTIPDNSLSTDLVEYKKKLNLPTKNTVDDDLKKEMDIFEKNKRIIEWADFDLVEEFEKYILNKYVRTQGTLAELQPNAKRDPLPVAVASAAESAAALPVASKVTSEAAAAFPVAFPVANTLQTNTAPAPAAAAQTAAAAAPAATAKKWGLSLFGNSKQGGKRKTRNHRKTRRLRKRGYRKTYKH